MDLLDKNKLIKHLDKSIDVIKNDIKKENNRDKVISYSGALTTMKNLKELIISGEYDI